MPWYLNIKNKIASIKPLEKGDMAYWHWACQKITGQPIKKIAPAIIWRSVIAKDIEISILGYENVKDRTQPHEDIEKAQPEYIKDYHRLWAAYIMVTQTDCTYLLLENDRVKFAEEYTSNNRAAKLLRDLCKDYAFDGIVGFTTDDPIKDAHVIRNSKIKFIRGFDYIGQKRDYDNVISFVQSEYPGMTRLQLLRFMIFVQEAYRNDIFIQSWHKLAEEIIKEG